ncbi:MAG: hypothetical protein H7Y17_16535 [Chlorobia bacterium]|nr:hypothetical protein [Fimbriimonadaceae bacterium]
MFKLTSEHLAQLFQLNEFPYAADAMVFVGLRGCLPVNPGDQAEGIEHQLAVATVDHLHPRCTLVQWSPKSRTFAVFPGSTVPHESSIEAARKRNGSGANQLLTGFYSDYRKGWHKAGTRTGHEAWRQSASRPTRRSADDLDYDGDDRVEIVNPADNLHAGWSPGLDGSFSSAGCQVVVGYPKCESRGDAPATGPWRTFQERGYKLKQQSFGYGLFNGGEIRRLVLSGPEGTERVRYGSKGERAKRIQAGLKAKDFYEGKLDGDFGPRSLRALLGFQEATFGKGGDDGICGSQTAEALGVKLT